MQEITEYGLLRMTIRISCYKLCSILPSHYKERRFSNRLVLIDIKQFSTTGRKMNEEIAWLVYSPSFRIANSSMCP